MGKMKQSGEFTRARSRSQEVAGLEQELLGLIIGDSDSHSRAGHTDPAAADVRELAWRGAPSHHHPADIWDTLYSYTLQVCSGPVNMCVCWGRVSSPVTLCLCAHALSGYALCHASVCTFVRVYAHNRKV